MNTVPLGEVIVPARVIRAGHQDFPVLSMTMHDGLVPQADRFKKRIASVSTQDYKVVQRGQLVVGFPIDEGVLDVQNLYDQAVVSPAYGVWNLTSSDLVDSRYLIKFLRSPKALTYYKAKLQGSTARRRSLPASVFLELPVFLPPLSEQRRIAAILDKADAIRTKRRQVLAHLDLVATALTAKILEDRSWTSVLSAYAVIQIGPFGSLLHKSDYIEGGIPVINPVHIKNGVLIPDSKFSISEDKASELSLYRLLPGDVVMGRRGEMGRAAVVQEEHRGAVCGTGSLILRPRIKPSEIIHAIVTSPRMRSHLERSSLGATLPNLNASIVNNAPVPDLDEHLAIRFSDTAHSMKAIREKVDSCSAAGEELFASLQSRAFKGEL